MREKSTGQSSTFACSTASGSDTDAIRISHRGYSTMNSTASQKIRLRALNTRSFRVSRMRVRFFTATLMAFSFPRIRTG